MRPGRRRAVLALLCLGLAYASVIQSFSWNQTSHYALIRSLAHGTASIDRYADQTNDKARYRGHWYSSRAPGLGLLSVPAYGVLTGLRVPALARAMKAQRNADEMVWALGLWGAVLPAVALLALVRLAADRLEPGYGTAAVVTLGLGSLVLPLGTLLFSHVLAACLAFAAFVLLLRERDGPPRTWWVAVAGGLAGYAMTTEYALLFAAVVIGLYALARGPRGRRALAYAGGVVAGLVPLAVYNQVVYGSITHVAYSDLSAHQSGFFGLHLPRPVVAVALLSDSRGLLTLAPVLICGLIGIVLVYRRGHRAEALVIAAVCASYLLYNAGYFLPFGGGSPGPRYLVPTLPFLGLALAAAYRRLPGPTLALGAISATTMVAATLTHPLVGYESETGIWSRLLSQGFFQPTIVTAAGGGRGWGAIVPFLVLALGAVVLAASVTDLRLSWSQMAWGAGAAAAWALYAALGPTGLGIDHAAELRILAAGDPTALQQRAGPRPLLHLALLA
ncbi:MAG TPA: hypothetical protein VHR88_09190, partial [Solirubrobacteraceae bacterium]|nr:hypothetical protein [Solirubrobacteraceae bacterium]